MVGSEYVFDVADIKCVCVGDSGLLVCRLDNSPLATEKDSRLLLYHDTDSDLDNLSCSERLAKAQLTSKDRFLPLSYQSCFVLFYFSVQIADKVSLLTNV